MPNKARALGRAGAHLEGWERATEFALMLRDASQRTSVYGTRVPPSRCDAPQHEGERARCISELRSINLQL